MISALPYGPAEITNIVGVSFNSWAQGKVREISKYEATVKAEAEAKKAASAIKSCNSLFGVGA